MINLITYISCKDLHANIQNILRHANTTIIKTLYPTCTNVSKTFDTKTDQGHSVCVCVEDDVSV